MESRANRTPSATTEVMINSEELRRYYGKLISNRLKEYWDSLQDEQKEIFAAAVKFAMSIGAREEKVRLEEQGYIPAPEKKQKVAEFLASEENPIQAVFKVLDDMIAEKSNGKFVLEKYLKNRLEKVLEFDQMEASLDAITIFVVAEHLLKS